MYCRWVHIIPPEKTMLKDAELLQTLNSIHGWNDVVGPYETSLIEQCEKACAIPLEELNLPDVNTLVMQKIGLDTLVKIAVPIVELAPWMETEYYPGDLISSLINADEEISQIGKKWLDSIGVSVRRLLPILKEERSHYGPEAKENIEVCGEDDFIPELEKFLAKWSFNVS